MLSEINLHRSSKHENICDLKRVFEDEDYIYMLLELCSHGVFIFKSRICTI